MRSIDRSTAETYAEWFRCLADPTRIEILNLLALEGRPMRVGEIVERVSVGQSTVSAHLKRLAAVSFVLSEARGTTTLYWINDRCLTAFPTAAEAVMGTLRGAAESGRNQPHGVSRRSARA
jgi:DNA-binding transcriptional ArsR family regulator